MDDIKKTVADNITFLRKKNGLTQIDLAEKLNYSDKAVSKWERGESLPDVCMLKQIADMFGVTLDYLVSGNDPSESPASAPSEEAENAARTRHIKNRAFITLMSVLLVWLLATVFFITVRTSCRTLRNPWLSFVIAIPVSCIVWLVLNSVWFNSRRNFLIISILMWSLLTAVFLTLLSCGFNFWMLFLLGIPGQIIIIMWSGIRKH